MSCPAELTLKWDDAMAAGDIVGVMNITLLSYTRINGNSEISREEFREELKEFFEKYTWVKTRSLNTKIDVQDNIAYVSGSWKGVLKDKKTGEETEQSGTWRDVRKRSGNSTDGFWLIQKSYLGYDKYTII